MTRVSRFRIAYVLFVVGVMFAALWGMATGRVEPHWLILVAVLALIPGRVQAYALRDLNAGVVLMSRGDYSAAERRFVAMLDALEKNPALRFALYMGPSGYTSHLEAMTRYNLGSALLHQGRAGEAEPEFDRARELDPGYALPHVALAVVMRLRGDAVAADAHEMRARELGHTGGAVDQLAQQIKIAYAQLQRGSKD